MVYWLMVGAGIIQSLERILYVWAIRLPEGVLPAIEADTFWCLSKLLDGIQDNYISHQPGIQRLVKRMGELVKRIDGQYNHKYSSQCRYHGLISFMYPSAPLASHFEEQGVEFMQFAFRWMNCLLMRELSLRCTVRMWDTYLVRPFNPQSKRKLIEMLIIPLNRPKERMPFLNSIYMYAQLYWSNIATDYVRWISK